MDGHRVCSDEPLMIHLSLKSASPTSANTHPPSLPLVSCLLHTPDQSPFRVFF